MTKIMLAMSGGVDSSCAAMLLQKQGYDVAGITMYLGDAQVVEKAKASADYLGIEHHVIDLSQEFQDCVVGDFAKEYLAGHTPNPCVICNKQVKLGKLFQLAEKIGFDYFATGHYAKIVEVNNRFAIAKGDFLPKDQSYYLYTLGQDVLSKLMFPLGEMSKEQVRAKANEFGLPAAAHSDSQDICFIPDGNYRKFLEDTGVHFMPGDFVDKNGKVLGQHLGIANYTIGQRKGLGIAFGHPVYVTEIRAESNQVVLGLEDDLFTTRALTKNNQFMLIPCLQQEMKVEVKVRYKSPPVQATIRPYEQDLVEIIFDKPEKSITPGQSGVFYLDQIVVGGGVII